MVGRVAVREGAAAVLRGGEGAFGGGPYVDMMEGVRWKLDCWGCWGEKERFAIPCSIELEWGIGGDCA